MSSKSSIKYASVNVQHLKDVELKKPTRKSAEMKNVAKANRRSQSLDRTIGDNSGDSREERRNRRQFMQLVRTNLNTNYFFECFIASFFFTKFGN